METHQRIGGSRFVFGPPPGGFGAKFYRDGQGGIVGKVTVDDSKMGPPGHVHGGALAALVDEVMGAAAWTTGLRVLAVNLNINLRQAVPLHVEVQLRGRVDRQEGRKVFTVGQLFLPDGTVAVEGSGIFVQAPHTLVGDEAAHNPFLALEGDD